MRTRLALALTAAAVLGGIAELALAPPKKPARKRKGASAYATVEEARKAGPDFDIQGEYEGTVTGKSKGRIGVQVIALGRGAFQAAFLPGGLPGAGWDAKNKILCEGKLAEGKVKLEPVKGSRKYLAGPPDQFCATRRFPPEGQADCTATIADGTITGELADGGKIEAKKVQRKSPTLGAKPPKGAVVLLAYEPGKAPSLGAWTNDRWLARDDGAMQVVPRSKSSKTKKSFSGPWRLHVEFTSPFMPTARGQGRGNSGVYAPGGREVQVLDSFGLDGLPNECGGIYKNYAPKVNMCLPPLSWQTYDIDYHPAGKDAEGKSQPAWYKVVHNGVTIHEKVALGGSRTGGLNLQDHGNPVAYRNIWIVVGQDAFK